MAVWLSWFSQTGCLSHLYPVSLCFGLLFFCSLNPRFGGKPWGTNQWEWNHIIHISLVRIIWAEITERMSLTVWCQSTFKKPMLCHTVSAAENGIKLNFQATYTVHTVTWRMWRTTGEHAGLFSLKQWCPLQLLCVKHTFKLKKCKISQLK